MDAASTLGTHPGAAAGADHHARGRARCPLRVTAAGSSRRSRRAVCTREVHLDTMESRVCPGCACERGAGCGQAHRRVQLPMGVVKRVRGGAGGCGGARRGVSSWGSNRVRVRSVGVHPQPLVFSKLNMRTMVWNQNGLKFRSNRDGAASNTRPRSAKEPTEYRYLLVTRVSAVRRTPDAKEEVPDASQPFPTQSLSR